MCATILTPYLLCGLICLILRRVPFLWGGTVKGEVASTIGVVLALPSVLGIIFSMLSLDFAQVLVIPGAVLCPAIALIMGEREAKRQRQPRPPMVFTVAEVAVRFNLTEETILELIHTGRLEANRIGAHYRITNRSIDNYLKLHSQQEKGKR